MRVFIFMVILMFGAIPLQAHFEKRDSLLKSVPKAKEDTSAVLLYLAIGDLYEGDKPEQAKVFYRKAYRLSQKIKYNPGIIKSLT